MSNQPEILVQKKHTASGIESVLTNSLRTVEGEIEVVLRAEIPFLGGSTLTWKGSSEKLLLALRTSKQEQNGLMSVSLEGCTTSGVQSDMRFGDEKPVSRKIEGPVHMLPEFVTRALEAL